MKILKYIFISFLIIIIIKTFIFENNLVVSSSMSPTLIKGDRLFTKKFSFGLFIPFTDIKFINYSKPQKGEIVVFYSPSKELSLKNGFKSYLNKREKFVKRVVAIEGDYIKLKNDCLYVNSKKIDRIKINNNFSYIENSHSLKFYRESIKNYSFVSTSSIIKAKNTSFFGLDNNNKITYKKDLIKFGYKVPKGYFFVIGDNRNNSNDSRFFGPIPYENLIGKVFFRWFSYGKKINWDRIFNFM